jgi:hypothetical protein
LLASFKVVRKAPEKRGPWEFDDGGVRDDDDDGGGDDLYIYIIYTIYIYENIVCI